MSASNIGRLINLNRFQNGFSLVPLVFYIPFGIVLTIVRCFIFAQAILAFYVLSKIPLLHSIAVRFMLAVCGLVVTTNGDLQSNDRPLILVANHVSSLDPFVLNLLTQFSLTVEPFSNNLNHLCNQVLLPAHMSKGDVIRFLKQTIEDNKIPVLIFPEGCRGSGFNGLLAFRVFPFQLGTAVQPIGIVARRWFFNISVSTYNSPWWADLLFTFFVPFTIFSIKFLPITEHRDQESDEQFGERVQSNLGRALGILATNITQSDVKEYVKCRLQGGSDQLSSAQGSVPSRVAAESSQLTDGNTKVDQSPATTAFTSSDPALNILFKQVREVLPHANSQSVLEDLGNTWDVDATITNILEGRVNLEQENLPPRPSSSQTELEASTFKAATFPKSASDRQLSLQERKQAMLEAARRRYKETHGIP